jgi:Uma2 family endonuclease
MAIVISPRVGVTVLRAGWPVYEALLAESADGSASRFAYDGALLEIMSPSAKHEIYNRLLEAFIREIGREWKIDVLACGSMTVRTEPRGAEADSSFYIGDHAARMREIDNRGCQAEAPPDIVVEIDISRERIDKMTLYAGLDVAELWRYDGRRLRAYDLSDDTHPELERSARLGGVALAGLDRFLELRATMSHSVLLDQWRKWLQDNPPD